MSLNNNHQYCPKCGSKLMPEDKDYMLATGVCSSCVSYGTNELKLKYTQFVNEKMAAQSAKLSKSKWRK